jgi:hypothetical protein
VTFTQDRDPWRAQYGHSIVYNIVGECHAENEQGTVLERRMLDVLRQMTRAELAEVFAVVEEPAGPPEEVPRALAASYWPLRWGAGDPERFVLVRAAHALGMGRELQQKGWTNTALERRIYAALCAQAIGSAEGTTRSALLAQLGARVAGEAGSVLPEEARQAAALRACLETSAGLRAFAALPESLSLAPQFDATRPTPLAVLAGMVSPGGSGSTARAVTVSRWGKGLDLRALFRVLTLCWRARQRLLLEHRAEAERLQGEIQATLARIQERDETAALERRVRPWFRRPASSLAVAGGAFVASLLQSSTEMGVIGPSVMLLLLGLGGAGFAWLLPEATGYPERHTLLNRLTQLRRRLAVVRRQMALLEQ